MANPTENKPWRFNGKADRYDHIVAGSHPLYARYEEVLDAAGNKSPIHLDMPALQTGRCPAGQARIWKRRPSKRFT